MPIITQKGTEHNDRVFERTQLSVGFLNAFLQTEHNDQPAVSVVRFNTDHLPGTFLKVTVCCNFPITDANCMVNLGIRRKSKLMRMSYNKLWKLLIDKGMTRSEMRKKAGISSSSLAKLGKGENVTTAVLLRICEALNCGLNEIADAIPDKEI